MAARLPPATAPWKWFVIGCTAEKASDLAEPDRQGIAEANEELVGLARKKQPEELHDCEDIQEPLTDPEADHKKGT